MARKHNTTYVIVYRGPNSAIAECLSKVIPGLQCRWNRDTTVEMEFRNDLPATAIEEKARDVCGDAFIKSYPLVPVRVPRGFRSYGVFQG